MKIKLLPALLLVCLCAISVWAQEGDYARNKNSNKTPHGILNSFFAWSGKSEHGMMIGSVQSIDLANGTFTILNQSIAIDDNTIFLGKLQGLSDLKVGRAVLITTQVDKDKLTALEIYRMPRPTSRRNH